MMTARQYEESLRELNLEVYMFGRRVNNVVDDPVIRPSMQAVAQTYELAHHHEIARLAQNIAGGLMVTLPSEKDFEAPGTQKWVEKYFKRDG